MFKPSIIVLLFLLGFSFCSHSAKKYDKPSAKGRIDKPHLDGDTTKRKKLYEAEACTDYLEIKDVFTIGKGGTEVIEIRNGFFYIDTQGILDVKDGMLYNLKTQADRNLLYKLLGDSIICLRLKNEQHIFNLKTDYQYVKKRWTSYTFNPGSVETYNKSIVPVFENDSTLLVTDLKLGKVLTRIADSRAFSGNILRSEDYLYVGGKSLYKINLQTGLIELTIPLINSLSSNIVLENDIIIFWDKGMGMKAYDSKLDKVVWEYSSRAKSPIKLMTDGRNVYFNDERVKAVNAKTGELNWIDSAGEAAIKNTNITLSGTCLLTGMAFDSDAVIVLLDTETGGVLCNGYDMPDEKGFYRYTFYNYTDNKFLFAKDGGGYDKKMVKFELLKTK